MSWEGSRLRSSEIFIGIILIRSLLVLKNLEKIPVGRQSVRGDSGQGPSLTHRARRSAVADSTSTGYHAVPPRASATEAERRARTDWRPRGTILEGRGSVRAIGRCIVTR